MWRMSGHFIGEVDYRKRMFHLLSKFPYAWKYLKPIEHPTSRRLEIKEFWLPQYLGAILPSNKIVVDLNRMAGYGIYPGTFRELLAFVNLFPHEIAKYPVAAYGSTWIHINEGTYHIPFAKKAESGDVLFELGLLDHENTSHGGSLRFLMMAPHNPSR